MPVITTWSIVSKSWFMCRCTWHHLFQPIPIHFKHNNFSKKVVAHVGLHPSWEEAKNWNWLAFTYIKGTEGNKKQANNTKSLPGQSDLRLLPGDVGSLLRSLHGSVHLLPDLTGPEGDQVLPFAADQDVLFVLPFLFCAIGKRGAAIAMTLVAKPLPLVL